MTDVRVSEVAVKVLRRQTAANQQIRTSQLAVKALRRQTAPNEQLRLSQLAVKVLRAYLPEEEPPPGDQEEPTTPFTGQIWPRPEELGEGGEWIPDSDSPPVTALNTAWATIAPIATGRYANVLLTYDGKIWAIGGRTSNTTLMDVSVYDVATNTWSVKPGAWPAVKSGYGAAGVGIINRKFYIAGGTGNVAQSDELWAYDPSANSWAQKATMPQGRYFASTNACYSSIGNKLYVAGGATPNPGSVNTKTLLVYDQLTNTWSSGPDMPGTPMASSGSVLAPQITVLDGKLYVACVTEEAQTVTSLFVYDPATNAWSTRTGIPSLVTSKFGIVPMLGKLYMIYYDGYWLYDPATDSWTNQVTTGQSPSTAVYAQSVVYNNEIYRISSSTSGAATTVTSHKLGRPAQSFGTAWTDGPSLPISLTRFGTFTIDKVIYVCGGRTQSGKASRRVFALDTMLPNPSWVEKAKMPAARTDVYAGKANKMGFIIGGKNADGDEVRTVYRYNPDTDNWVSRALLPSARYSDGVSSHKIGSDGLLYLAGGTRDGKRKKTLYIYDPEKDRWTSGPDMPVSVSGNVIVARGSRGMIYSVSGSRASGAYAGLYVYDTSEKVWFTLIDAGVAKDTGSSACICAGKLILTGAGPDPSSTPIVRIYDIASNTWSTGLIPNNPMNARGAALTVTRGNMYLIGGSSWSAGDVNKPNRGVLKFPVPYESEEEFSPLEVVGQAWPRENVHPPGGYWEEVLVTEDEPPVSTNGVWVPFSNPPGDATAGSYSGGYREGAHISAYDGKLYYTGGRVGWSNGAPTAYHQVYDPDTDQWTTLAPMPSATGTAGVIVSTGGQNGGGWIDGKLHIVSEDKHYVYDPVSNSWETKPSPPTSVPSGAFNWRQLANTVIDGKLYAFYGRQLRRYNPATGNWTDLAVFPTSRYEISVIGHRGRLWLFGGNGTGSANGDSINYYYDPATDTYTQLPASADTGPNSMAASRLGSLLHFGGGWGFGRASSGRSAISYYDIDAQAISTSHPQKPPSSGKSSDVGQVVVGTRLYQIAALYGNSTTQSWWTELGGVGDVETAPISDTELVWHDTDPSGLFWA